MSTILLPYRNQNGSLGVRCLNFKRKLTEYGSLLVSLQRMFDPTFKYPAGQLDSAERRTACFMRSGQSRASPKKRAFPRKVA